MTTAITKYGSKVKAPSTNTDLSVPQWDGTNTGTLKDGLTLTDTGAVIATKAYVDANAGGGSSVGVHGILSAAAHTGVSSTTFTRGDILIVNSASSVSVLPKGSQYDILTMGANDPYWSSTITFSFLDMTSAQYSIPFQVGTAAAPITEGWTSYNSTTHRLTVGDGTNAIPILDSTNDPFTFTLNLDGGGSALTTGDKKVYKFVPYNCSITSYTLLSDVPGRVVIDIWKGTYSNFDAGATHPVDGDSITGDNPPALTTNTVKNQDTTLTGWNTSLSSNDVLGFNVDACQSITRVSLALKVKRS